MLQRFVELECVIKRALALSDTDITPPTTAEWEMFRELCDVLR